MKCPNCDREVEKGNLFCTHCLSEIPWVQEYNTVETLMEKKKMEEPEDVPDKVKFPVKKYLKEILSKYHMGIGILGGLVLCVLILGMVVRMIRIQTYDEYTLYNIAKEAYVEGNYTKAMEYAERTLEKDHSFIDAEIIYARVLEIQGNSESAAMVMETVIKTYPEHAGAFKYYIRLLSDLGRTMEVKEILDACTNQEILMECAEYISEMPVVSLEEGTYGEEKEVALSNVSGGVIYYTLDGTIPSSYSIRYTEPIILPEGTTTLNAICINDKQICSDVLTKVYVISTRQPESPQVVPGDGEYFEKTKIEVGVPEGYRAFYAFDEIPTMESTEYLSPITMPVGYHELYVIVAAENGITSEPTKRVYNLQY